MQSLPRFRSLSLLALPAVVLSGLARPSAADTAQEPAFVKKTYTCKTVGDCRTQADVYRADDAVVRPRQRELRRRCPLPTATPAAPSPC